MRLRDEAPVLGPTLALLGAATVVYNGRNYWRVASGNRIAGGYAAGRAPSSFPPQQLRLGTRVEMEHTTDADIAREIAMDHPAYYTKLREAGL
jgi:hypothetical protein